MTSESENPDRLSLGEAFRAAFYMTEQYIALEDSPDTGLVLFLEYLRSDPACWEDWNVAIRTALSDGGAASPFR